MSNPSTFTANVHYTYAKGLPDAKITNYGSWFTLNIGGVSFFFNLEQAREIASRLATVASEIQELAPGEQCCK